MEKKIGESSTRGLPLVLRVKRPGEEDPLDILHVRHLSKKFSSFGEASPKFDGLVFKRTNSNEPTSALETASLNSPSREESSKDQPKQPARKILRVARGFRPVLKNLHNLDNQLQNLEVNSAASSRPNLKRHLEGDENQSVVALDHSYSICDLEICAQPSQSLPRKKKAEYEQTSGITCNGEELLVESVSEEKQDFVYDYYALNASALDFDKDIYDEIMAAFEDNEYVLGTASENDLWNELESGVREEIVEDDDDSNAEDNWKNEYPDESEVEWGEENSEDEEEKSRNGDSDEDYDERDYSERGAFGQRIKETFQRYRGGHLAESEDSEIDD